MENKEQELFEQWAARNGHDLERRKTTTRTTHPYFSAVTNTAWEAWQARAKLNNQ